MQSWALSICDTNCFGRCINAAGSKKIQKAPASRSHTRTLMLCVKTQQARTTPVERASTEAPGRTQRALQIFEIGGALVRDATGALAPGARRLHSRSKEPRRDHVRAEHAFTSVHFYSSQLLYPAARRVGRGGDFARRQPQARRFGSKHANAIASSTLRQRKRQNAQNAQNACNVA